MPCIPGSRCKHCLTSTISFTYCLLSTVFVLGYHCLLSTVFVLGYVRIQARMLTIYVLAMPYVLTQLLMSVPAAATSIASCP
ncbi:hypothetical protein EV426DRAFT_617971 [Tirmania nivea]|nr:hypothetical protein EV426DRAFT_617971 [Tirmania nivea]